MKDTVTKSKYYPKEKKDSLFFKGYISEKSGHSRGSTVDITLIFTDSINYGNELDMGMDPKQMEWMANEVQNGSYLHCPNGSHMAMWDDSENYFNGLISYIKNL